jgi:hypothetical protein
MVGSSTQFPSAILFSASTTTLMSGTRSLFSSVATDIVHSVEAQSDGGNPSVERSGCPSLGRKIAVSQRSIVERTSISAMTE